YEVIENAAEIADIADCDEQTAAAIRFMVSKGYFSLDDAGNFDPNGTLNRYMFSEALVRMFFALDRNLTTSFTDVPQDSPYYPYVASGEQGAIIEGFEDNTFRGDNDVLREEVIALCSRTLADKKGYSYPTDTAAYLTFDDADAISDWARDTTALAVRETLVNGTGTLAPQQSISRGEAALLLYRLFMLLYEPPVAEMHFDGFEDAGSADSGLPPVALAVAGIVLLGGGAAGVVYRRKKRAPMPPKDDNTSDDKPSE
ncbi:MAG: S-layer homology domain-containing protein, partial [Butyricicoccus sp.]|nr:S-layer homology domain-containing protein [Butyricicoccus sp.]